MDATKTSPVRPFLKWAGGKYRLMHEILALLPNAPLLIEPFAGAGAVFLNTHYAKYHLNDINADLIHLYKQLKMRPHAFLKEVRGLFCPRNNEAAAYYKLRAQFNASQNTAERAALFLYLNRHGYNGLCRFNRSGGFNVPFGAYQRPYFPEKELLAFAQKAKIARFSCEPFLTVMESAPSGAILYCDPPYLPLQQAPCFTGYSGQPFTLENQKELAWAASRAAKRGCCVLISNHDTPFARQLYREARCRSIKVRRLISCKAKKRNYVKELLALFS